MPIPKIYIYIYMMGSLQDQEIRHVQKMQKLLNGVCAFYRFYFIFWLYWVFIALHGFSPAAVTRVYPWIQCGLLTVVTSLVAEFGLYARGLQELQCVGLIAPQHVGSSQTRDPTHVLCLSRQTLNHRTTREISLFLCAFQKIAFTYIS